MQLRRRWAVAAAIHALTLGALAGLLHTQWPVYLVGRWAALTAFVLGGELWLLWRNLPLHRRDGKALLAFGPGTVLTLARGLAMGLLAGFLLCPWPAPPLAWLPALLYTLAGLADYFDGYLARISGYASALGGALDIEFDALGVLVVSALAVHWGQWPAWFLIIGLARYLFVLGLWLRRRWRLPVYDLPPSAARRTMAGLQMGLLSVALWPIMPPALATLSGLLFGLPFLAIFVRDWLVVSGALDAASPRYLTFRHTCLTLLGNWAPLAARAMAALAAAVLLVDLWRDLPAQVARYSAFGLSNPALATLIFAAMLAIAILFLVFGAAVRFFAIWLLVPVGFGIAAGGFHFASSVAVTAAIYLLIFGPGYYSLWRPEERIVQRRAGE